MPVLFLLLFLAASAGHASILVVAINYLYGTRFRGRWVTGTRQLLQVGVVAGPLLFLFLWGGDLWSGNDWFALPPLLVVYLFACWLIGFGVFPFITVQRLRRRPPIELASNHTQTLDVARRLGHKPYGRGKHRWQAYLPGNEIFRVDFTELTLHVPSLPAAWDGLSILHVSDLHLGGVPDRSFYEWVLSRCAEEPCDLLALTGDVLDNDHHYEWIAPVLGRLRWRLAAFAVLGNHDSWADVPRIRREVESLGFTHVGGRWTQMGVRGEPLIVIGNEMPWLSPLPDLRDCPKAGFRLCLSHSPDQLPWAKRERIDLMLAGHNHGGQIRFPVIGSVLVPSVYSRRHDCGLFHEEPTLLHVSRGLAGTHPLRYNCRPEVTRLVLRATVV
jgi:predicted MPP superfamily phosphohydrolase